MSLRASWDSSPRTGSVQVPAVGVWRIECFDPRQLLNQSQVLLLLEICIFFMQLLPRVVLLLVLLLPLLVLLLHGIQGLSDLLSMLVRQAFKALAHPFKHCWMLTTLEQKELQKSIKTSSVQN